MNTREKINVHNKFRIEVRDSKTGELKQVGKAENMVLDTWGLSSTVNTIQFGSGTDKSQQNASMTSLIEYVGERSLSLLSTEWQGDVFVIDYRADQISAEEENGKNISEIGIYSSNEGSIISHAFVTDSEGNPLVITKSNLDVIVLYATVYFKRNERYKLPSYEFLKPVIGGANIRLIGSDSSTNPSSMLEVDETRRKKRVYSISNEQVNEEEIRGLIFLESFITREEMYKIITFPQTGVYEGTQISKGKLVGEKNSVNTQFDLPWDCVKNLKLYKNGQLISSDQYNINTRVKKSNNVLKNLKTIATNGEFEENGIKYLNSLILLSHRELFETTIKSYVGRRLGCLSYVCVKNMSEYIVELFESSTITHYIADYSSLNYEESCMYDHIKIDVYSNGRWIEIYNGSTETFMKNQNKQELSSSIENVSKLRVKLTNPKSETQPWKLVPFVALYNENDIHHITFNNPPLAADVLEYDGFVDYIPKDSNHIIKIGMDMAMTPGAGE